MVTRDQMKNFLEKYRNLDIEGDQFLNQIPRQIRDGYFDNPYVEALNKQVDLLLRTWLNSDTLLEEISWFLYDWNVERDLNEIIMAAGKKYTINSVDDFLNYLEDQDFTAVDFATRRS